MQDELTKNEREIIKQIRDLKSHETIQIMADAQGRPDSFLITRSHKVLLIVNNSPQYVRGKLQN